MQYSTVIIIDDLLEDKPMPPVDKVLEWYEYVKSRREQVQADEPIVFDGADMKR